ncbi:MAG: hypothetical protein IPJ32_00335 [Sphingobacteriaceae bacterium]|nr:hypothetical protein [Sphingobacteriaceae bacterium]
MKTIAIKILSLSFFLTSVIFTGCKKDETAPGTQGPQGPAGQGVTGTSNGFISGTLSGTMRDGTPFSEPFSFSYYFGSESGTLDSLNAGSYNFSLSRQTNDVFTNNYAYMTINTASKNSTTGTITNMGISLKKSIGSNKVFYFDGALNSGNVTSLSYNASTGLFSGSFTLSIPGSSNNTTNTATVTGNFQGNVVQQVYRLAQGSIINKN